MTRSRRHGRRLEMQRKTPERGRVEPSAKRVFILLACATLALAIVGIETGPKVVRQVWHIIGVRRVESQADAIFAAADESGLDPCLLAAVMYVESRGQVDAVSSKDALGLLQLMPSAAHDAARRLRIEEPTREALLSDAALNVRLGANHLAWLVANEGPDLERALVAYNVGRGKLARWCKEAGGYETWRAGRAKTGDFGPLVYAHQVLDFRERFRARGVLTARVLATPEAGAEAR